MAKLLLPRYKDLEQDTVIKKNALDLDTVEIRLHMHVTVELMIPCIVSEIYFDKFKYQSLSYEKLAKEHRCLREKISILQRSETLLRSLEILNDIGTYYQ